MRVVLLSLIFLFVFGLPASAAITPNDPLFPRQWYLQAMRVPDAWQRATGSRDVVVAVIDSGVDEDHEDLVDNLWMNVGEIAGNGVDDDQNGYIDDQHGWDFITREPSPNPKFQSIEEVRTRPIGAHHGTLVSGLIAARGNNGKGMSGVVWQTRIMPLRALGSTGQGNLPTVVEAIDYAVKNGAHIINLSFNISVRSPLLLAALRRAYEKGVLVVAAAGNDSDEGAGIDLDVAPSFPVCATGPLGEDYVFGVAASDRQGKKAHFSHFGSRCVDITTPGVEILSTQVRSPRFGFQHFYSEGWEGTSFATALVSGAAALLKGQDLTLTGRELRAFLEEGATNLSTLDPVYGPRLGAGLVNVEQSAVLLQNAEIRARIRATLEGPQGSGPSLAVTFTDGKRSTELRRMTFDGTVQSQWFPFSDRYRGNAQVIAGDMDRDGRDEVLVHGGVGGGPHVRIFNREGNFQGQFFAFEQSYRGGMSLALGDPNPDGKGEFIAISGKDRATEARVLSLAGEKLLTFSPFGELFSDGGEVRSGDVDGDGLDDLVFVTRRAARPVVRVTNVFGAEKFSFSPWSEDVGPVSLALADVDGDGVAEIVTARGQGIPEVRVWQRRTLVANFLVYASTFRNGVVLASGDVNGDGRDEIITVPRERGGPHVRIFSGDGFLLSQFFAREASWRGGMTVTVVR